APFGRERNRDLFLQFAKFGTRIRDSLLCGGRRAIRESRRPAARFLCFAANDNSFGSGGMRVSHECSGSAVRTELCLSAKSSRGKRRQPKQEIEREEVGANAAGGLMDSPILSSAQMRAAEEAAFSRGVKVETLMDQAGAGVAHAIQQFFPNPGTCVVFAGKGHNGGDALVAATHLQQL